MGFIFMGGDSSTTRCIRTDLIDPRYSCIKCQDLDLTGCLEHSIIVNRVYMPFDLRSYGMFPTKVNSLLSITKPVTAASNGCQYGCQLVSALYDGLRRLRPSYKVHI